MIESIGCQLFIELDDEKVYQQAGGKLRGQIHMDVRQDILGKALNLYLKGFEDVAFGMKAKLCGRAPIIVMQFAIAKWTGNHTIEKGQYSFPFAIDLPDWLPASLGILENEQAIAMHIKYMLVAQIEGTRQF